MKLELNPRPPSASSTRNSISAGVIILGLFLLLLLFILNTFLQTNLELWSVIRASICLALTLILGMGCIFLPYFIRYQTHRRPRAFITSNSFKFGRHRRAHPLSQLIELRLELHRENKGTISAFSITGTRSTSQAEIPGISSPVEAFQSLVKYRLNVKEELDFGADEEESSSFGPSLPTAVNPGIHSDPASESKCLAWSLPGERLLWSGRPIQGWFINRTSKLCLYIATVLLALSLLADMVALHQYFYDHIQNSHELVNTLLGIAVFQWLSFCLAAIPLSLNWLTRRRSYYAVFDRRLLILEEGLQTLVRSIPITAHMDISVQRHARKLGSVKLRYEVFKQSEEVEQIMNPSYVIEAIEDYEDLRKLIRSNIKSPLPPMPVA